MKISDLASEEAILDELGRRIARRRLDLSITQAEVAERAKWTYPRYVLD